MHQRGGKTIIAPRYRSLSHARQRGQPVAGVAGWRFPCIPHTGSDRICCTNGKRKPIAGAANRAYGARAYTWPHTHRIERLAGDTMNAIPAAMVSSLLLTASFNVTAETLSWEGRIASSRAVVQIPITLANPLSGVVIWTDSYQGGERFDPITALWRDGMLLGENDDWPWLMPGQTSFDSGLRFDTLEAGSYLLTITNYYNFANGSLLADGFRFDDPLYPASNLNNCRGSSDCPGNFWRVHLQDNFLPPAVPEPAHALLLATGTLLLAGARWRDRRSC